MTTTAKELSTAIKDLQELFDKADDIISSLSNDARDALLNYHSVDTNLVHVVRSGVINSDELVGLLNKGKLAYIYDEEEDRPTLSAIETPFKAKEFPSNDHEASAIIYVIEDPDLTENSFTYQDFIGFITNAMGDEASTIGDYTITNMAHNLWDACDGQHPITLIDELGIDYFKEDHPKLVIRSVSEQGFWSSEQGWVYDVESATRFPARNPPKPKSLPISVGGDAELISENEAEDFDPNLKSGM